ncbi:MAG: adenylate kinase [Thermoanaerobaculia bacterium]|nr:MAG: adenylate kinase [Thermoanaerobaculia bacterium]MBZ0101336.1 adenylate kinase [Thermoanaerobaculia bacterium]
MSSAALRVVLLGAPGSGKGTQAEKLSVALAVPAISTGEMLRRAVAQGTELGRRVDGVMSSGRLVDDELMAEVVRERLAAPDAAAGFLLDGYPRTAAQAATLDGLLAAQGSRLDAVVFLDVPEEVLVQRSLARRRQDDREEVIRERQRVYREQTEPLVELFEARGLLHRIDGDRTMDEVTRAVLGRLGRG